MKKLIKLLSFGGLISIIFIIVGCPVIFLISGSIKGNDELVFLLASIVKNVNRNVEWTLLPQYPTLRHFINVMFDTPEFWVLFWNSMKIVCLVVFGQVCISIPAAWGFAIYRSRWSVWIFRFYVFLMLLPFQTKMLADFLLLENLKLIDTHWSIVMPGIFSTYPIFILFQFFMKIPREVIESARLDGAGEIRIFLKMGVPLAKNGIISVLILSFIEYWNMIEQPLIFLERKDLWPLSLYMPTITETEIGGSFAKIVITTIPLIIIFWICHENLKDGIKIMVNNE